MPSSYEERRRTVGGGNQAEESNDIELGGSQYSEPNSLPETFWHGIGSRSIYGYSAGISPRSDRRLSATYSQTRGSIRDQTMLLSGFGSQAGFGDGINYTARASAATRRSSLDDRATISQILSDAQSDSEHSFAISRRHSTRESYPVPASVKDPATAGSLPPMDLNYLNDERLPKNAKPQQSDPATVHSARRTGSRQRQSNQPNWHAGHATRDPKDISYGGIGREQQAHLLQPPPRGSNLGHHGSDLDDEQAHPISERDHLLSYSHGSNAGAESSMGHFQRRSHALIDIITWPMQYIPAVVLGLILNLLDGLSYGLIAFPVSIPVFDKFGPVGFSMYMLSTAVSQFVYSCGASAFRGANGSMLIEAIPFLYAMCDVVIKKVGEDNPDQIIATTLAAYALSSIVTGIIFFALGFLRLGSLVDFFPRHILVGCIGGVGYFLFQTGMEVTSQIKLGFSWDSLRGLFALDTVGLWTSSLTVAIVLRALNSRFAHPLFVPVFFMAIPVVFYAITAAMGLPIETLRSTGWVFQLPEAGVPFYHFYTLFDFGNTNWGAVKQAFPTMLGLAFFSILHVPINVPALAVSTNVDKINTNRELVAHGISNSLSGLLGTFQNYLVYSNSLLFIRSGGNSRLAGFMLGVATLGIFFIGPTIIGYIPTMVVGALIFHLGIELMKEALVDTVGVVNRTEYATIILIVLSMAILGFNEGIFLGILLACFFFIFLYSQRSAIRKTYTGSAVRSTVRRLYYQRHFLDQVSRQIQVMRLQGFMFFGTINGVEASIRKLLDQRQWEENPIRFLVLDFGLVTGMDFSAAEAFIRIRRILEAREIYLVICGVNRTSEVGRALCSAGVWSGSDSEYVQTFQSLNEALEWCENVLLQYHYLNQAVINGTEAPPNYYFVSAPEPEDYDILGTSPRKAMVTEATQALVQNTKGPRDRNKKPPAAILPLLQQAFQELRSDTAVNEVLVFISSHFACKQLGPNHHLWHAGSNAVGMYIVESGTLRVYVDADDRKEGADPIESILPGTTLGELSLVTGKSYSTNVVTDCEVTLWELSKETFDRLCISEPVKMLEFVRLALAYSAQGMDSVTAYAFCAQ